MARAKIGEEQREEILVAFYACIIQKRVAITRCHVTTHRQESSCPTIGALSRTHCDNSVTSNDAQLDRLSTNDKTQLQIPQARTLIFKR